MLICSDVLPSAPRSCWEFTLKIQSQMGKNTRTGETTKKAKHGSFCCDGKEIFTSLCIVGCAMRWVSTKLTAEQVGEGATKRQEGKKPHKSNVLSATRAQHLSRLPFLIHPGNSCADCLKEGQKRS